MRDLGAQVWGRVSERPAKRWHLTWRDRQFRLELNDDVHLFGGSATERISVRRSWFQPVLRVSLPNGPTRTLRRLNAESAKEIRRALDSHRTLVTLEGMVGQIQPWATQVLAVVAQAQAEGRWIPKETVNELVAGRPEVEWTAGLRPQAQELWTSLTDVERAALSTHMHDLWAWIASVNNTILESELVARRQLFDRVESSPLTEEQARAVVCFDNRVNVIAAAGSGKTSVMVGRTAYAIDRGFVAPNRILLLAFNRDAARELQARLASRLQAVGLPTDGIRASTFHSFGLSVIGRATGQKPRLARWLERGQDVEKVSEIVDLLRDSSPEFCYAYDTFRLFFARAADDPTKVEPDAYHPVRKQGFRTFSGDLVRSQGEKIIADFLYIAGIEFEYERTYPHVPATAVRSEYRPDFYYPKVDAWHEHWALDEHGNPPVTFAGYREDMARKKRIHRQFGTDLIETTWAEIRDGAGITSLWKQLTVHRLVIDWNPEREISDRWARPPAHEEMARLIRTFMAHVKSNALTRELIEARLTSNPSMNTPRTRHFLALYWPIHEAWQAALAAEGAVDFEDMLVRAADFLDTGAVPRTHDLVLVDEFQDISQARARLVRGLVNEPGRYLLTVGDDWQAINRFAGADISVMTHFGGWFGDGPTLHLSKTFRCTQEICDVSSTFVMKNPRQLQKNVTAASGERGPRVVLQYAANADDQALVRAVYTVLERIARTSDISDPGTSGRSPSVYVLGRYNFDSSLMPPRIPQGLSVTFKTIHSSKGLEADYVIVANMSRGRHGFPSEIVDDPVLDLAMSAPDDYAHSEERRLFYVALTRARKQVFLVAAPGRESLFITELAKEEQIEVVNSDQQAIDVGLQPCPVCSDGLLVQRNGKYGPFLGCNRFPRCDHTERDPRRDAGARDLV